jgi:quinol monooxygenase YgiN
MVYRLKTVGPGTWLLVRPPIYAYVPPASFIVLSVWETYEHHKKLMEGKDYGQLVQDLKPALSGKLVMQHVDFDADSTTTFTSPATEWVTFTVKPEVTQEELVATFKKLAGELLKVPSCHSAIHGQSREHKGRVVAALGWDSVEVCIVTLPYV